MTTSHGSLLGVDGVAKWVSGATYGLDRKVWSPLSKLVYVRIVAGSGTTDPAEDATNWALFGPTRPKDTRRGVILLDGAAQTSDTATLSPAVNTAKARLRTLGCYTTGSDTLARDTDAQVALTNGTTITATRGGVGTGDVYVSWELDEDW